MSKFHILFNITGINETKHINKNTFVTIKENNIVFMCPDVIIRLVNSPPLIAIKIDSAVTEKPKRVAQIPKTILIVSIPSITSTLNSGFVCL